MTRNLDKVFTRRESQQKSHISTQHQKRHGSCRRSIFSPASADFGKRRFFVTFRCVMAKTSLDIKTSRGVASDVHHMAAEALITSRYLRWSSHSENSFKNKKNRKELFLCAHPEKEKTLYYYIHRRVSVPSAFLTLFSFFFFLRRRE